MAGLAGKDMSELSPDQLILFKDMLYNINMGYSDPTKLRPGDSIATNSSETGYLHPWSFESIMETYEYHKLHEFMSVKDYLEMPSFMVDRIIKGRSKGRVKRRDDDARRKKEEEERKKQNPAAAVKLPHDIPGLDLEAIERLSNLDLSQLDKM